MTRDPRPTAPPVPGKGGTRGLDTTDMSPGVRHPATLDDYLRTHEAGPASHAIRFPRGPACRRHGTTPGRSSSLGHSPPDSAAARPSVTLETTVPTEPGRHLTRYGSPVGQPVVGSRLRQGRVPLSATHRQAPRL